MAIDLHIPSPDKLVKKTFELPQSVVDAFDQYVEAAQESADGATEHIILRALIERQLKKDRKFRKWLSSRPKPPRIITDTHESTPLAKKGFPSMSAPISTQESTDR